MTDQNSYDVIIVGGSYAGLSAAMALGRSLRKTLVIDSGDPCNKQTPHSHNFLTQDGKPPAAIAATSREQVASYETVEFRSDFAISAFRNDKGFEVVTESGAKFLGRKLVFGTGVKDEIPEIKGFAECWGVSVIHCPYCHGYEVRGQQTGIMANGERAMHLAALVNNLTDHLTILTNGDAAFDPDQLYKLNKHGIKVIESEIEEIEHAAGQLENVVFQNGKRISFQAVYAAVPFSQHSSIPEELGCELDDFGFIKVDDFQLTTVDGVYACGDNATFKRSVANAVSAGNIVGAKVNMDLVQEEF